MELPNLFGPGEVHVSAITFWWGHSVWSFFLHIPWQRDHYLWPNKRCTWQLPSSSAKFSVMYFQEEHLAL